MAYTLRTFLCIAVLLTTVGFVSFLLGPIPSDAPEQSPSDNTSARLLRDGRAALPHNLAAALPHNARSALPYDGRNALPHDIPATPSHDARAALLHDPRAHLSHDTREAPPSWLAVATLADIAPAFPLPTSGCPPPIPVLEPPGPHIDVPNEGFQAWCLISTLGMVRTASIPIVVGDPRKTNRTALYVETRANPLLINAIRSNAALLGKEWGVQIYAPSHVLAWYRAELSTGRGDWANVVFTSLETTFGYKAGIFNPAILTRVHFLKISEFWETAAAEHVLIAQHHGNVLRGAGMNATDGVRWEEFLQYSYVGGVWASGPYHGGNGGFSLRRRSAMITYGRRSNCKREELFNPVLCDWAAHGVQGDHEDGYWSTVLVGTPNGLPPRELAVTFSVETTMYIPSLGIHVAFAHHSTQDGLDIIANSDLLRVLYPDGDPAACRVTFEHVQRDENGDFVGVEWLFWAADTWRAVLAVVPTAPMLECTYLTPLVAAAERGEVLEAVLPAMMR